MSGKVIHLLSGAEYDLYIGRAMPRYGLAASREWQNPFPIKPHGRDYALERYERMIRRYLEIGGGGYEVAVARLADMTLACWCAPKDGTPLTLGDEEICHGQVLLRLAGELT